MFLTRIMIVIATLALLGACNDSTPPEQSNSDLRGQVVDELGRPVAGAVVILQLATDPLDDMTPNRVRADISFELSAETTASAWIASYCDGDTLDMLFQQDLPAGQHVVAWYGLDDSGRTLPDGIYHFHLVTEGGEDIQPIPLLHFVYEDLTADTVAPQAVSDSQGRFAVPQACLPFGFSYESVNELGEHVATNTFSREVSARAFADGYASSAESEWVTVDPNTGADVTVTLDP